MKKLHVVIFLLILFLFLIVMYQTVNEKAIPDGGDVSYFRSLTAGVDEPIAVDFSKLDFTPWDVAAASSKIDRQSEKDYTVMVYMNGSDLESEGGAATDDLIEMLHSGFDSNNVNLILFTGGTNRWQNNVIPENNCMIWKITGGYLEELANVGLLNMGDPGTLSGFIDFSMLNFPANKYGLVLWDHGGGSIAGYGHDEKFNNSALTLLDINLAFEKSEVAKNKLEFLGFDSCLMATVEMAVIASKYANYLVASEDLEPGDGWDYSFLSVLNDSSLLDGAAIGMEIADRFMDYYGIDSEDTLTISVVDLSNVDKVMDTMGDLMSLCSDSLLISNTDSFSTFAKRRYGTKTFGVGSPRDNESDMVDIAHMAYKLSDLFPKESANVISALENSVVYNRHNSHVNLGGLSTFYIYGGKNTANVSLPTYAALNMDKYYTDYLFNFASLLNGNDIYKKTKSSSISNEAFNKELPPVDELLRIDLTAWYPIDGKKDYYLMTGIKTDVDIDDYDGMDSVNNVLWPSINGEFVCLYDISTSDGLDGNSMYAIPASLNGKDCDIIVVISNNHPYGKILGARQDDGFIIQKGFDKIIPGDKISFYYQERYFGSDENNSYRPFWIKGSELTVDDELKFEWHSMNDYATEYRLLLTDVWYNEYFSSL